MECDSQIVMENKKKKPASITHAFAVLEKEKSGISAHTEAVAEALVLCAVHVGHFHMGAFLVFFCQLLPSWRKILAVATPAMASKGNF